MTRPMGPNAFLRAGQVVAIESRHRDARRRIIDRLSQALQTRNVAILLGAGASYHLNSPRIRNMELSQFLQMASSAEVHFTAAELEVLQKVTGGNSERFDLETILADLSTAVRFVNSRYARDDASENSVEDLRLVRAKVNRALALACDLAVDDSKDEDELKAHKAFFARVLASRRSDLPRARVFTTNYDLVIEKALDVLGIDYIDGFVGTVNRTLRLDVYSREYYMATSIGSERRPRRLADFLYLYKVHGSLNWRSRASRVATISDRVVQISNYRSTPVDDLALIYPTPQKEADTLGYPYSDLLRAFGSTLTEPDTALFTIGYGFSDDHINRIISQSLASNATLAIVLVDPYILEASEDSLADNPVGRFAATQDARVSAVTGANCVFEDFATTFLPAVLDDETPLVNGESHAAN